MFLSFWTTNGKTFTQDSVKVMSILLYALYVTATIMFNYILFQSLSLRPIYTGSQDSGAPCSKKSDLLLPLLQYARILNIY